MSSDGEVQGVGLLIASDPHNGRLVVMASITGGPADRAGVQAGDEVSRFIQVLLALAGHDHGLPVRKLV